MAGFIPKHEEASSLKVNSFFGHMHQIKHLLIRRLPFGLFSWRFLLPGQPPAIRLHRHLVMQHHTRLPRWLWFWIMLFTGLRWVVCYSGYYSYRAVSHWSGRHDLPPGFNFWQTWYAVLSHSLGHGVSPASWYQFQLYRTDRHWADFVYDHETAAYHLWHNRQRPDYLAHQAVLSDKSQFAHYLSDRDLISAGTWQLVPQHTAGFASALKDLAQYQGRLFCKRRSGNQGIGAFYADWVDQTLQVQPLHDAVLPPDQIAAFLQEQIAQNDYLIQPCYQNHPLLQVPDLNLPAITLRLISSFPLNTQHPELMGAYLEWPALQDGGTNQGYLFCGISRHTGQLLPERVTPEPSRLQPTQQNDWQTFIAQLSNTQLPHWHQATQLAQQAHCHLHGIYRIAWDFILTEERAVLLEGNVGWRVSTPQAICPDFKLI
jgi:hypothetical protein